jgi:hypothetical protein
MPTGKDGNRFWERLVILEQKVANVMTFQKWQMVLLTGIFLAILRVALK